MKQITMKKLLVAGVALAMVPGSLLAQKEDKDKKDKKETQTIVITRNVDADAKTVIEIDGDKVKVNGKDAKDDKDISVHVNTFKAGNGIYRVNGMPSRSFNYNWNDNDGALSLFSEDANRAMLGVATEENDKGAEVQSITKESGAEKAGLKKGDIITKIDERKIESSDDVTEAIHDHKPGDKVSITYLRDGKEQKITAELSKWKGIKMNAVSIPRMEAFGQQWRETMPMEPMEPMIFNGNGFSIGGRPRLGLSIQDTDDGVGVKVLEVEDESNAAKAGIRKDDIILGIDDTDVKGTEDVVRATRSGKDKNSFNFKVKRDGKTQTIEVKYPKKLKTADL